MRKNVAGQVVVAKMLYAADGTAFDGGSPPNRILCYVSGNGAARALGTGTSPSGECFHVGGGTYAYFPTQAETNYDHVSYSFEDVNAETIPVTIQVYTRVITATEEAKLQRGVQALVTGTVASGASTTSIPTNLSETTADHYNGRTITFTSGALAGQSTDITDYGGADGTLTVTALTEAPDQGDEFVIS